VPVGGVNICCYISKYRHRHQSFAFDENDRAHRGWDPRPHGQLLGMTAGGHGLANYAK